MAANGGLGQNGATTAPAVKRLLVRILGIGARTVAVLALQVVATILLAFVVRPMCHLGYGGANIAAPFAYGIPAILAFVGLFRFALKPPTKIWTAAAILAAAVLAVFGQLNAVGLMQAFDKWRAADYADRLRAQIHADPRFNDVHVLGYSDSYVLLPYVPIVGKVATEEDWQVLEGLVRASHPPVKADVCVFVGAPPEGGGHPQPRIVHID
jgi:hypothetical protein